MTGLRDYTACKLVVTTQNPLLTAQIATELMKLPMCEGNIGHQQVQLYMVDGHKGGERS